MTALPGTLGPDTGPESGLRPVTPAGILAERLGDLVARAEAGEDTASLLVDLTRAHELAAGLEPYVAASTSPESSALSALAARTREAHWSEDSPLEAEMLSGHVEGRFLRTLVRATGARRVLEVGMFTGYSALAMAEALPDGSGPGSVVACELDPGVATFAQECFDATGPEGAGSRIDVRVGPASDTLAALAAEGAVFDLVFVDADKTGYADYVRAVLDTPLLAPDGLLALDNTLLQGEPYGAGVLSDNGRAIADVNRLLADDDRVEQVLLPLRDGVTLVQWATGPTAPARPTEED
ncbi:class I SAM-dependent methyltransferase [Nocardioides sp. CFH 31398]|uniref:O-methyltransferase n=1 Tax=Nocardioides sp. CFH 31398 TaxID=2919579 RepID=UPI001F062C07|nr:class I SAM-dependent methyltransferase [Nocardioides sp. CFH 31398]MCH1865762.1 class I SAM-dependent methyltransferase [Nocardioides sp. CFH 31398]